MNPVPTVYPQKVLSKHLRYQHIKLFGVFPEKDPSQINFSISTIGFQFKEINNCVLYFHLVFEYEAKLAKILESIRVDDDLHLQLQCNSMPFALPQWFVQGHNTGNTEKSKFKKRRKLPSVYTK